MLAILNLGIFQLPQQRILEPHASLEMDSDKCTGSLSDYIDIFVYEFNFRSYLAYLTLHISLAAELSERNLPIQQLSKTLELTINIVLIRHQAEVFSFWSFCDNFIALTLQKSKPNPNNSILQ